MSAGRSSNLILVLAGVATPLAAATLMVALISRSRPDPDSSELESRIRTWWAIVFTNGVQSKLTSLTLYPISKKFNNTTPTLTRPLQRGRERGPECQDTYVLRSIFSIVILVNRVAAIIFLVFVSFLALKEYLSMIRTRHSDRQARFRASLPIPVKRDLVIRNYGALLPGHGGVLVRVDSLSCIAPLFFHFFDYKYS